MIETFNSMHTLWNVNEKYFCSCLLFEVWT